MKSWFINLFHPKKINLGMINSYFYSIIHLIIEKKWIRICTQEMYIKSMI